MGGTLTTCGLDARRLRVMAATHTDTGLGPSSSCADPGSVFKYDSGFKYDKTLEMKLFADMLLNRISHSTSGLLYVLLYCFS